MTRSNRINTIKKKAKVIKAIMTLVGLCVFATIVYTGVSLYSIINTDIQTGEPKYGYNQHDKLNLTDDTIDYKINVTITNKGLFSIKYIKVNVSVFIHNSTNNITLPWGAKVGDMFDEFPTIEKGNSYQKELILGIPPNGTFGFLFDDAWLRYEFKIDTEVTVFPISVNGTIFQFYDHTSL